MGREEGSGWGTHVYLWWIHFDIWQNQYNIVKFKNKIKLKKKKKRIGLPFHSPEDLPDSEIKPGSPGLQADSLQSEPLRAGRDDCI